MRDGMSAFISAAPPAGACDCHVHFYGPAEVYPLRSVDGLPPQRGSAAEYREVMRRLGLQRVVAVQSILYAFDNRCMLDGMALIGRGARGVATIAADTPEAELRRLHDLGVRGARAFMLPGGSLGWNELPVIARRIEPLGWNLQLQLEGRELAERAARVAALPGRIVIDHNGRYTQPIGVDHRAFVALLRLLDSGRVWVKVSGMYDTSLDGAPGYGDVAALARELIRRAPQRMLWGTNWPHPGRTDKPDEVALLALLGEWVPSAEVASAILVDNPATLYQFDNVEGRPSGRGSRPTTSLGACAAHACETTGPGSRCAAGGGGCG
jgi:D-galactarolactone isomerase